MNDCGAFELIFENMNRIFVRYKVLKGVAYIVKSILEINDITVTKITIQFIKQDISSDVADNIKGSKKKHVVRKVGLNFEAKYASRLFAGA